MRYAIYIALLVLAIVGAFYSGMAIGKRDVQIEYITQEKEGNDGYYRPSLTLQLKYHKKEQANRAKRHDDPCIRVLYREVGEFDIRKIRGHKRKQSVDRLKKRVKRQKASENDSKAANIKVDLAKKAD